jgi:hypothetical protein
MDGVTLALHLSLIRLGKGMISAYEKWVRTKARMSGLDPGRTVAPGKREAKGRWCGLVLKESLA